MVMGRQTMLTADLPLWRRCNVRKRSGASRRTSDGSSGRPRPRSGMHKVSRLSGVILTGHKGLSHTLRRQALSILWS
jgi:hypothetical protein